MLKKKNVSVKEYIAYRDRTNGCMDVEKIYYTIKDKDTDEVLLEGQMIPGDEAKSLVLGTHPSGNRYSSVVLAAIDLETPKIRAELEKTVSKQELDSVSLMGSGNVDDGTSQVRRIKAITCVVQAIDEETNEVWIEGVI